MGCLEDDNARVCKNRHENKLSDAARLCGIPASCAVRCGLMQAFLGLADGKLAQEGGTQGGARVGC